MPGEPASSNPRREYEYASKLQKQTSVKKWRCWQNGGTPHRLFLLKMDSTRTATARANSDNIRLLSRKALQQRRTAEYSSALPAPACSTVPLSWLLVAMLHTAPDTNSGGAYPVVHIGYGTYWHVDIYWRIELQYIVLNRARGRRKTLLTVPPHFVAGAGIFEELWCWCQLAEAILSA